MRARPAFPRSPFLLLLLLAAACGDDELAGTGGGGGSTTAATTAATTASTPTSTSSGIDSGGGDGASTGAGGEGGAGEGGAGEGGGEATGGASAACEGLREDDPQVTVVTVDADGTPVEVERVLWQPAPADQFWPEGTVTEAVCADGGEAPCSAWAIDGELPDRIAISSSRRNAGEDTDDCLGWASAFVQAHTHDPSKRQLVHLTLPSDGTYCVDPETFATVLNHEHDEQVDEADCLAPPEDVNGAIVLHVVDEEGEPLPATIAHWYYHPEGPDYDGEHPLACADLRCESWVVREEPMTGTVYLNATYAGPLNPYVQTGWNGYEGTPIEVELDDRGEIVPVSATLRLVILESATGG